MIEMYPHLLSLTSFPIHEVVKHTKRIFEKHVYATLFHTTCLSCSKNTKIIVITKKRVNYFGLFLKKHRSY